MKKKKTKNKQKYESLLRQSAVKVSTGFLTS